MGVDHRTALERLSTHVLSICSAYESGFGHGLDNTAAPNPYAFGADADCFGAWQYGHEQGSNRRSRLEPKAALTSNVRTLLYNVASSYGQDGPCWCADRRERDVSESLGSWTAHTHSHACIAARAFLDSKPVETKAELPYTPELHHALWVAGLRQDDASHAAHYSACVVLAAYVQQQRGIFAKAEAALEARRQLARDQLIYGTSYQRIDADGTSTRIDPSTIMIAPQPEPESSEKSEGSQS